MFKWSIKSNENIDKYGCDVEITGSGNCVSEIKHANIWVKLFTGAIIGFVNGFWGGGGGMICVPLLQNVIKLPEKKAYGKLSGTVPNN